MEGIKLNLSFSVHFVFTYLQNTMKMFLCMFDLAAKNTDLLKHNRLGAENMTILVWIHSVLLSKHIPRRFVKSAFVPHYLFFFLSYLKPTIHFSNNSHYNQVCGNWLTCFRHCQLISHKVERKKRLRESNTAAATLTTRVQKPGAVWRSQSQGLYGAVWANTDMPGNIWLVSTLTRGSFWEDAICRVVGLPFQEYCGIQWEWLKQNTVGNKWMFLMFMQRI